MSDSEPASKRQKHASSRSSQICLEPAGDSQLRVSFTVPSDTFVHARLIGDVLEHGGTFNIDMNTTGILTWMAATLQAGPERASALGSAHESLRSSLLQVGLTRRLTDGPSTSCPVTEHTCCTRCKLSRN